MTYHMSRGALRYVLTPYTRLTGPDGLAMLPASPFLTSVEGPARSMQKVSTIGRVRRYEIELTPVPTLGRQRPL